MIQRDWESFFEELSGYEDYRTVQMRLAQELNDAPEHLKSMMRNLAETPLDQLIPHRPSDEQVALHRARVHIFEYRLHVMWNRLNNPYFPA